MKLLCCLTQNNKIYKQDFSSVNEEHVLNDSASILWQDILSEFQNANQLFEAFFSKCSEIVNKHFQLKRLSHREVKFNSNPWITKALGKSINYKNIYIDNSLELNLLLVTANIKPVEANLQGYYDLEKNFTTATDYFLTNHSNVNNVWKGIRQLVPFKPKRILQTQ